MAWTTPVVEKTKGQLRGLQLLQWNLFSASVSVSVSVSVSLSLSVFLVSCWIASSG